MMCGIIGSGKQQFLDHIIKDEIVFDTCIIDEAAQSTEVNQK
jgi:superfamily I DNA and/or RNA helicase